jgi:hypothetical protein
MRDTNGDVRKSRRVDEKEIHGRGKRNCRDGRNIDASELSKILPLVLLIRVE